MASTALTDFKISIALAQIGFGTYGMLAGYGLMQQAQQIYEQQQQAAVILQRLLPRAREQIRRAEEETARLQAELDTLQSRAEPPLSVLPARRFIDNGVGVPARWSNLPFTLDSIQNLPGVTSTITEAERRRRLEEAEARRRAAEAEARAAARREREIAEDRHERNWRDDSATPSPTPAAPSKPTVEDDSNSCWKRHCLGGGGSGGGNWADPGKIIDEINKQTRGSGLGPIKQ
jgi:hypothetical protein